MPGICTSNAWVFLACCFLQLFGTRMFEAEMNKTKRKNSCCLNKHGDLSSVFLFGFLLAELYASRWFAGNVLFGGNKRRELEATFSLLLQAGEKFILSNLVSSFWIARTISLILLLTDKNFEYLKCILMQISWSELTTNAEAAIAAQTLQLFRHTEPHLDTPSAETTKQVVHFTHQSSFVISSVDCGTRRHQNVRCKHCSFSSLWFMLSATE